MLKIKSKIFTGLMVALFVLGAVLGTSAGKVSAATWTPTSATIITKSSSSANVMWLQSTLNAVQNAGLVVDGAYGKLTTAAIKVFQAAHTGLTVDGVAGPHTIAALNAAGASLSGTTVSTVAGCTSTSGFSPVTGASCSTGTTVMTGVPAGCTTTAGFSTLTGLPCNSSTGTVQGSGTVTAMLATDNPAAGNLIQGQATADLAHFAFTGNGTLSQVTLQRSGISDNSVFPNVYLYSGNTRLTDSASMNSQGQIVFNGLNIAVNGTLDLSVRADIVGSSTGVTESTVAVTLTGYMVSGATTATVVNIPGNMFIVNSGTGVLSSVTVGTNTVAAQAISAGTTGIALWSAPVNVSLHAVWLKSASFDVIGSAPANAFANLGLFANGVQIATSTGVNAMGYITFDLTATPYSLPTGATTLEVRGDVVNGSSRTVQLSLQHASDLMVTDSQVGVNVSVTNVGGGVFSINQGGIITINQGSLVVQSDPTFNSQTNVTGGASNVAIASYKLTSYGEDVKVNSITVTPTITGAPAACSALASGAVGLENVTLYYNGAPVGSSQNAISSGGCTFNTLTFTPGSNLTISGGTTGLFQIHADLINGAGTPQYSTGSIGATVAITQYQGVTSGQTGSLSSSAFTSSNAMTIQTGSLTVGPNAAFLSQTINPNTSGAHIASFTLQNQSTSEAVQVNSLTVGLYTNATLPGTALTTGGSLPLTDFSTLTISGIPGTVTPIGQPTASNVFSTNFTIPAGGSQTVDVYANVGSTNGQSFAVQLTPTAVGANSRVTISSSPVAGQLITLGVGSLNTPSLVTSQSTNPQYISSGGTGAISAANEVYNFVASSGTANITGLKFAALTGVSTTTTAAVGSLTATGSSGSIAVGSSASFNVGDNVLVTTTGVFGGQDAVGTITAKADGTHITVNVTTPMVGGWDTAAHQAAGGATGAGAPAKVYQLATNGATAITLNSAGVATGSATFNGGIAYVSSITGGSGTGIMVPNNPSGVTVPAFVSYGPVNTNGGVASGTTSSILLEYVQYQTGSNTSYIAPTDTSATGTTITLVGSKPNLTVASSGTTPTAPTSDLLLGTVTIAADNTGDILIHQLPLLVSINSGTNGGSAGTANITSVKLTDTNDVSLTGLSSGGTCTAAANSSTSACVQTFSSGNYYRISAGSSKTFEVHATTAGAFGTSASISFGLGTSSTFLWGDVNGGATATGGATPPNDLTGASLYSYPNASVSIHN